MAAVRERAEITKFDSGTTTGKIAKDRHVDVASNR
jgi:hypothetical protein